MGGQRYKYKVRSSPAEEGRAPGAGGAGTDSMGEAAT